MNAKPDYKELDEAILAHIGAGGKNFSGMVLSLTQAAQKVALGQVVFRVIDRRLHHLRKAEKIQYSADAGWTVQPAGDAA